MVAPILAVSLLMLVAASPVFAAPINLLVNPGFETGDFSGWTVGGNSIQVGVATDGTSIPSADSPFPPNFQNVRSGQFAGNALVKTIESGPVQEENPVERITLSQTIFVSPNTLFEVGFWLGNDSNSPFGMLIDDDHTQIFVDGSGLLGSDMIIDPGSGPGDFNLFSTTFDTGLRTEVTVEFAINGSGTARVGVSFDDFFLVPEPSSAALLLIGIAGLLVGRLALGRSLTS